jgi:CubicO group peptidase (beta-lactamase class C family)
MRYLFGFVFVLAASPLSASAQDAVESETPEPSAEEPVPPSEPAPEERALQLQLEAAGVEIVPIPPTLLESPDRQEIERMERRVKRAKIGYGVSTVAAGAGLVMGIAAGMAAFGESFSGVPTTSPGWIAPVGWTGVALLSGGVVGMITSGILMKRRKRERDGLGYRVQWDLARSRLVF